MTGDGKPLNYVAIDIETTGLNPTSDDIIEIGAVRIVNGEEEETFHRFVARSGTLSSEIQELTGITDDMLKDAPSAEVVLPELLKFIGDDVIVAHNLTFDASFLQQKCEDIGYTLIRADGICTLTLTRILAPTLTSYRLESVARAFQLDTVVTHRALADAQTCARIFHALRDEAAKLPLILLQQQAGLAGLFSSVTADWFSSHIPNRMQTFGDDIGDDRDVRDGLLFTTSTMVRSESAQTRRVEIELSDLSSIAHEVLAKDGKLSQALRGYEPRLGQLEMVKQVSEAFQAGKHAVIEAGTGTGKSMAYLIPAVLYALATGERVVVSTHTMALQDQIEQRDFPTLQTLFDDHLQLSIQKGRKNYVCLRKVKSEAGLLSFASATDEIQMVMSLLTWLSQTAAGAREELSTQAVSSTLWTRVQSETDSCINKRCPFFRPCYYFRAKSAAQMADVVVTNHSLLLSDVKAGHRVLPKYDALVIDEAHHLEEQATKHLGSEVHAAQVAALSHRLSRDRGKHGVLPELRSRFTDTAAMPYGMEDRLQQAEEWVDHIQRTADAAFQTIGALVPPGKTEFRLTATVYQEAAFLRFADAMESLRKPLASLRELVKGLQEWSKVAATDDDAGRIIDAAGFLDGWLQSIELLDGVTTDSPDLVTWIERRGLSRPRLSVHRAPIDVSHTLKNTLFDPVERVVLTSATLSIKGNFDYTIAQLGLTDSRTAGTLLTANVSSPFDYGVQARLCIPSDVPELAKMSAQDAALWLGDSLFQLAVASEGRVLTLFTSHQMLKETAKLLRDPLRQQGLSLLAQDVDGGRTAMLDAFRRNPRSVLLGAQSFWEGIDLPGDQLTTLVIVRLPFAPPSHPVTEARHERLEASGTSAFWASSLPDAVVRFRQGFGRLIRTSLDKGVVVVYDKRLITQRYGQTFIQSLPGVKPLIGPEREMLQQIKAFLSQSPT